MNDLMKKEIAKYARSPMVEGLIDLIEEYLNDPKGFEEKLLQGYVVEMEAQLVTLEARKAQIEKDLSDAKSADVIATERI